MFATVRRYEGIDSSNIDELTKKVGESLAPKLSKLPGFSSYFLIDTGNGVMSSIGLFETLPARSKDSVMAEVIVHKLNGIKA